MHIRIAPLVSPPETTMAQLEGRAGLIAAYALRPMDGPQPLLATVWETVGDADSASVAASGQNYADVCFYDTHAGADSTRTAAYVQILYFDGPLSPAQGEAMDRANRERIWPTVRGSAGNLGAYVGRNPDGSSAVVSLTSSLQAVEDSQLAIMAADLLPAEDAALLTGPDRMQLGWVLSAIAPQATLTS